MSKEKEGCFSETRKSIKVLKQVYDLFYFIESTIMMMNGEDEFLMQIKKFKLFLLDFLILLSL